MSRIEQCLYHPTDSAALVVSKNGPERLSHHSAILEDQPGNRCSQPKWNRTTRNAAMNREPVKQGNICFGIGENPRLISNPTNQVFQDVNALFGTVLSGTSLERKPLSPAAPKSASRLSIFLGNAGTKIEPLAGGLCYNRRECHSEKLIA